MLVCALSLKYWFLSLLDRIWRFWLESNAFQSIFLYHDLRIVHFFVGHVWTNESEVDSTILWWSTDDSPHPLPYPFLLWHSLTLLFRVSFSLDATNLSCLQVARRSWTDSRRLHTFKMTTGQTCQQIQFKLDRRDHQRHVTILRSSLTSLKFKRSLYPNLFS